MINQEILNDKIIGIKKLIATAVKNRNEALLARIQKLSQEVCLVVAEFKCEKCKLSEKLTLHHLIMRRVKEYTDFWRYASQRYYWANSIILCVDCHAKYHNIFGKDKDEMGEIPHEKVEKIKMKYELPIVW